jgi:hypothetical protein
MDNVIPPSAPRPREVDATVKEPPVDCAGLAMAVPLGTTRLAFANTGPATVIVGCIECRQRHIR